MYVNRKYPYDRSLPLYRHKELYEWNDEYQKRKFFTDADYEDERRLYDIWKKGELDRIEREDDECLEAAEYLEFRFSDRYGSLRQDTVFFRNLVKVEDTLEKAGSYSEFLLKCAAKGISERKANFILLYYHFNPGRIFSYYYWNWTEEKAKETLEEYPGMTEGYAYWLKFEQMRRDAFSGRRHNCATYAEFIEKEL